VSSKPAATPALTLLEAEGVAHVVHRYRHDPVAGSFGTEAADTLGLARERVFKTLMISADGRLAVAVVPVSGQLDLKAAAHALGAKKAVLAGIREAERATGYVIGGISPLGQKKRLPLVLDISALALPAIFVSGGRRGLEIELAPADLVRLTGAAVAPIGHPD
jgi:Cys-tRNA(Pro)/Cys-tRNA(Cys) deacylase